MSSDLWSFALSTYARPGAESACLQLQAAGVNVCLLLCGLWLEQRGVSCNEQRLEQLRNLAISWDADVVRPLRALRVQWKTAAAQDVQLRALRERVKALELDAERHLLMRLEQVSQGWPHSETGDLTAWLEAVTVRALDRDALHQLRVAATGS